MSCCKEVDYPSNDIEITVEFQNMTMTYENVLPESNQIEELEFVFKQIMNGIGFRFVEECWLMTKKDLEELKS